MKRAVQRLLSLLITFSLVFAGTMSAAAANPTTGANALLSSMEGLTGIRTNLTFLEGRAGDTHLVYTYEQDENSFKVVEDFSEGLTEGNSTVYILNPNGDYDVFYTQEVSAGSDEVVVTFTDTYKAVERVVITPNSMAKEVLKSGASPYGDEWITEYYSGSTFVRNMTVNAIISALAGAIGYHCAGPVGAALVAGISSVATSIFQENVPTVYYDAIYNWRNSPKNWLVIDETEWSDWYSDSARRDYIGHTYYEYIF